MVSAVFVLCRVCRMGENRHSIWCVCFVLFVAREKIDILSGWFRACLPHGRD